jgi:DNA-binding response OmpR family regulator
MKILAAEDEPVMRMRLQATLKKWGYDPLLCGDGEEALRALSDPQAPRLVLLDWMMPGLEGPEVCRRVRQLDHGAQLHIILLTSRDTTQDLVEGLNAGANDYVRKPFEMDELKARLDDGRRVVDLQDRVIEAERYRTLTQAAGAAAHEINQPLTTLLGASELVLARMQPDDPDRQLFDMLVSSGERIRDIVRQMLTLREVVTMPYIQGHEIIDFRASSADTAPDEKPDPDQNR